MTEEIKPRTEEERRSGPAGWMVTFSDLSTLLLTFFVLLLSMSSMDNRKLKSMFTNFTSSCGILLFKEYGEIYQPREVMIQGITQRLKDALVIRKAEDPMEDLTEEMEQELLKTAGGLLEVEYFKDGFKIVFGHQMLFRTGSAELREDMRPVLEEVARFMKYTDYQVYIDGHTDEVPVRGGPYGSNRELSLARAAAVMDYLVEEQGLESAAIALGGYGPMKPRAEGDSPEDLQKNRRVEVIFKNKKYF